MVSNPTGPGVTFRVANARSFAAPTDTFRGAVPTLPPAVRSQEATPVESLRLVAGLQLAVGPRVGSKPVVAVIATFGMPRPVLGPAVATTTTFKAPWIVWPACIVNV